MSTEVGRLKAKATRLAAKHGHARLSASGAGTDYKAWAHTGDVDGIWRGDCAARCVACGAEVLICPAEETRVGGQALVYTCAQFKEIKEATHAN